jgi:hypothetical protein
MIDANERSRRPCRSSSQRSAWSYGLGLAPFRMTHITSTCYQTRSEVDGINLVGDRTRDRCLDVVPLLLHSLLRSGLPSVGSLPKAIILLVRAAAAPVRSSAYGRQ